MRGLTAVSAALALGFHAQALAAQSPGDSSVALGIGNIIHTYDYSTESFSVVKYFQKHPIHVSGRELPVRLVDMPVDAMVALTGHFDGTLVREPGENALHYDQTASITLWLQGKKTREFKVACKGATRRESRLMADVRAEAALPCLEELRRQLENRLATESVNRRSAP